MTEKNHQSRLRFFWLLFWPVYGLRYLLLEQVFIRSDYFSVYAFPDDWIPFREEFLIFYTLWYFLFAGMHLYTCFADARAFRQYSRYLVISMSVSTLIFLLFPSCQNLRPSVLPRENLLSAGVAFLYRVDTNTNVCPSEHVIGAVGVFLAAAHTVSLQKRGLLFLFAVLAALGAISTVFLKQHSVVDILTALPVCFLAWYFSFRESPSD